MAAQANETLETTGVKAKVNEYAGPTTEYMAAGLSTAKDKVVSTTTELYLQGSDAPIIQGAAETSKNVVNQGFELGMSGAQKATEYGSKAFDKIENVANLWFGEIIGEQNPQVVDRPAPAR